MRKNNFAISSQRLYRPDGKVNPGDAHTLAQSRTRDPAATRQRLLESAAELACSEGAARLSLEAVAARAGVSKGGLLYHFPTKNDLLRAMVASHVDRMRDALNAGAPGALDGTGDARLAVRIYLALLRQELGFKEKIVPGFLAAMLENPAFMEPVLTFRRELEALFARAADPALAQMALMACEGLVHVRLTDPARDMAAEFVDVTATVERLLTADA